jgi:hypothetical protein
MLLGQVECMYTTTIQVTFYSDHTCRSTEPKQPTVRERVFQKTVR